MKIDKSKMRNLGKKELLAPYLEKAIRAADFEEWEFKYENTHQGDTAWHPSSDCTPPASELYAKAIGEKVEVFNADGGLNKHMMVGHFWHQWLQHICLNLGFCTEKAIEKKESKIWGHHPKMLLEEEYRGKIYTGPRPYHWVTGSADIAPLELPKGWEGIVDFKTMSSSTFKKEEMPFAEKYECQINIYMDLFDQDRALVLGINKDSPHGFKEFQFIRNEQLIKAIYGKWKFVSEMLDFDITDLVYADEEFAMDHLLKGPV